MTLIHKHSGGGCQYIINTKGSELRDFEVHIYYCHETPTHTAEFRTGPPLLVCEEHANRWSDRAKISELGCSLGL